MTWAHYLLQVNIYLVIFYAFYKLLLDKETYFMLNRFYLIAAGLLSLSIPFMKPEWFMGGAAPQKFRISVDQLNMMMANVTIADDQAQQFNWAQLVTGIYLAGIVFFVARLIFRLFAVQRLIKVKQAGMAFSFLRKKVIDETLPGLDTINKHEEIHMRQLHTLDILFFELLGILVWCNPVIYLYKIAVKNIHEFLADEQAALFQGDKESYAMLLLSKAFGIDQNILTNSFFNKSLIKKRIYMLHQQRSKKTAILKYGLFLPLFAVMLLLSSAKISRNEEIKEVAEKISAPISIQSIPSLVKDNSAAKTTALARLDKADSWTTFYKYLSRSIGYPAKAQGHQLQGNTIIKFSIIHGEVSGIGVVSPPLGMGCDAQVMKTILGFNDFKAIKDGKYSIKVAFRLADANTTISNAKVIHPKGYIPLKEVTVSGYEPAKASASNARGKVYDFVSITLQPGFPGGMDKFYKYLAASCKYPADAAQNNIQGKVFLSFIVETDGSLSHIKVERGVTPSLDAEALRIMKGSPKWTPGYSGDQPVRVKYNIPVSFTLSDDQHKTGGAPTNHTLNSSNKYAVKALTRKRTTANSPLYIIDGVRSEGGGDQIDPNTIASINVIKDPGATTIYGEDGKNGVILVTTKKGKQEIKNEKPAPKN